MSDPTEYEPNSRDITDDADFPPPKCGVCGVPWADHMGIMGVCLWNKALMEDLVNLRKDNAQLYKERDEARREVCEHRVKQQHSPQQHAIDRGWDCFKKEETQ